MTTNDEQPTAAPSKPEASRRKRGQGGVEMRKSDGSARGYFRNAAGIRIKMPWCANRRDAEEQLQAALEEMESSGGLAFGGGLTLRTWGKEFLETRELEGGRNVSSEKAQWKKHFLTADFINWRLDAITTKDVRRWMVTMNGKKCRGRGEHRKAKVKRDLRPLSWQTKTHALNFLRAAFTRAMDDERITGDVVNPCIGLKFKKPPTVHDATNFFARPEIESIQKVAAPDILALIEFAIASAMRQGEMRALRDEDVHLNAATPHVKVRYGKPPKRPTKSGQPRTVPLLPMAVRALRAWYEFRDREITFNPKGLTFPAERGGYRSAGRFLGRDNAIIWKDLFKKAGITRHLVWHDLRHTGATALLGGYFGRKWRLEEIQTFLGHQDIATTERYAHALEETLNAAARETWGDISEAAPAPVDPAPASPGAAPPQPDAATPQAAE